MNGYRNPAKDRPAKLTRIPESEWPDAAQAHITQKPLQVWISRKYLVQIYEANLTEYPDALRITISRTRVGLNGQWADGLTWDELNEIKTAVGFADFYAVEVYPRGYDLINGANMRYLWVLPAPLAIGWFKT